MLQTVARGTYFGSPGAGAEEGQPLRWRHRSSAARGEPSGSQRSRETTARIRHGCRAHAARRKRQMGEEVGSLSALQGCQRCERTLALFSGLARRGGEPNVATCLVGVPALSVGLHLGRRSALITADTRARRSPALSLAAHPRRALGRRAASLLLAV